MDTSVILDSGHTAWMIVATLLVFMMTIPGIALFYGGLVRQKNMLSLVMQSLAIAGVVSILWVAFGYSLASAPDMKAAVSLNTVSGDSTR